MCVARTQIESCSSLRQHVERACVLVTRQMPTLRMPAELLHIEARAVAQSLHRHADEAACARDGHDHYTNHGRTLTGRMLHEVTVTGRRAIYRRATASVGCYGSTSVVVML